MKTLDSALNQTYDDLEILVVDDHSDDATMRFVRSVRDPRIRVFVNERNLGLVNNWNRCLTLANGSFVKFLFQDDLLYPSCVEKMASVMQRHDNVGIVFAPWNILLENPDDPRAIAWKKNSTAPHTRFQELSEVNAGIVLFNQWLERGFGENWIGGPSAVMLRKECVSRIGLFNSRIQTCADFEMWMRVAYFSDVGFVDQPLSAFTYHSESAASDNQRRNLLWLDWMWLVEGLLRYEEIRKSHPQIRLLRHRETIAMITRQVQRIRGRQAMPVLPMMRQIAEYFGYLILAMTRYPPRIHQRAIVG
jgi:glycosyltransferase involved in cell wall biosynthesis